MFGLGNAQEKGVEVPFGKWGGIIQDAKKIMEDPNDKGGSLTGRLLGRMGLMKIGVDEETEINEGRKIKPNADELDAYLEAGRLLLSNETHEDVKESIQRSVALFEKMYDLSI
ncbi:MAG: hypothetical protein WC757_04140 [Candidatus Paceibacterota bacterium]|jgi:hypothetical protein